MYRLVAKRLLRLPAVQLTGGSVCFRSTRTLGPAITKWSPSFCTTVESPLPSQNPNISFAGAGASSTAAGASTTSAGSSIGSRSQQQPRAQYQDEQVRVLNASLRHVVCIHSHFPFILNELVFDYSIFRFMLFLNEFVMLCNLI